MNVFKPVLTATLLIATATVALVVQIGKQRPNVVSERHHAPVKGGRARRGRRAGSQLRHTR